MIPDREEKIFDLLFFSKFSQVGEQGTKSIEIFENKSIKSSPTYACVEIMGLPTVKEEKIQWEKE